MKLKAIFGLLVVITSSASINNVGAANKSNKRAPNIILIFCDDMGYGDLSCYGNPSIATPNLDRMAAEGQKWTNFYTSASVSSPSRGGLLCGQYGVRSGLYGDKRRVLHPFCIGGIQPNEKTIAEYLKDAGYTTAISGKWHIGHQKGQLPQDNGFDYFFGIPYSSDMSKMAMAVEGHDYKWELPFYNETPLASAPIEYEPDIALFTKRMTDYSLEFIKNNKNKPFFLYFANPMPHSPVFASDDFTGVSKKGLYGDVIEEIDYNVGRILDYLKESKLDKNTLVIFTSDNGANLRACLGGGSAAPLRDGKGTQFEGGFRVPAIFWGKGVKQGLVTDIGSTLDLLPTFCSMANIPLLKDRVYDGYNLEQVISGDKRTERDVFYYYRGSVLHAIRKGAYKLHIKFTLNSPKDTFPKDALPWLYNVEEDVAEAYNIADKNPNIVKELQELAQKHIESYKLAPSQFDRNK